MQYESKSMGPKSIVLFSDGTGNSAGKFQKTNVWRLYEALDLSSPTTENPNERELRQIALYDDGVGTSGFKPVALIGGVFGYGLKRNVIDLYKFLCRNYQPGDRIYAFGFSRGAFTIRVLIGLIANQGLVPYRGERDLSVAAARVYRRNRARFAEWNVAGFFRKASDFVYNRIASGSLRQPGAENEQVHIKTIQFVGVWDTVAAYGAPIAEITRAIDRWIWPLSMPDYELSYKVLHARHALALDDERDTFHPLLWNEVGEAGTGKVRPDRLKQVWFAGMHADVGGGYAHNTLALVSLDWMMNEAQACGLRFTEKSKERVGEKMSAFGPMHDSRSGFGCAYRYQPRNLVARTETPDPSTLMMQDPSPTAKWAKLKNVVIHHSAIDRVFAGTDSYAPKTLPSKFLVCSSDGQTTDSSLKASNADVWNNVWRRRVTYFLGVVVAALLVLLPFFTQACGGQTCSVSAIVASVGVSPQEVVQFWFKSWTKYPVVFLVLISLLVIAMKYGAAIQTRIVDQMREHWTQPVDPREVHACKESAVDRWIRKFRTNVNYQRFFQELKWRVGPGLFAVVLALAACSVVFWAIRRIGAF